MSVGWLTGRAWLDEDGKHVWFAHDCTTGRDTSRLPWPTWRAEGDAVAPSIDWLSCPVTRQRGLKGAKPAQFNRWVLDLLGYEDGDELDDLFPGTASMAAAIARAPLAFGDARV